MTSCSLLGVLSSDVGTGRSRMEEVFFSGLPIEKTPTPIIQLARYARRYAKTLRQKPTLLRSRQRVMSLMRLDATLIS